MGRGSLRFAWGATAQSGSILILGVVLILLHPAVGVVHPHYPAHAVVLVGGGPGRRFRVPRPAPAGRGCCTVGWKGLHYCNLLFISRFCAPISILVTMSMSSPFLSLYCLGHIHPE